ncbi:MAG: hypothetical protein LBN33_03520, partial [Desulfovibrio sp.]|nr:hypothetical protein [Desulfovibrio sp.]
MSHPVFGNGNPPEGSGSSGDPNDNIVNVNANIISRVYGAMHDIFTGAATAIHNEVVINNSQISGFTYGGFARSAAGTATATRNTITITGSANMGSDIFGGYAVATDNTYAAIATDNIVNIKTSGSTYASIYGGIIETNTHADTDGFSNNTLNLFYDANTITNVYNFETVWFNYSGDAGITTLNTTASIGSGTPVVKLDTNGNDITFGGAINGTGG